MLRDKKGSVLGGSGVDTKNRGWKNARAPPTALTLVSLSLRLKDLLGPVTRVKKMKKKLRHCQAIGVVLFGG